MKKDDTDRFQQNAARRPDCLDHKISLKQRRRRKLWNKDPGIKDIEEKENDNAESPCVEFER